MIINHDAVAGTLESGDALVRVAPDEDFEVNVSTSVETQYGDTVRAVIAEVLERFQVSAGIVTVVDKGALDCILRARVEAAVSRGSDEPPDWSVVIGGAR